MNNDNSSSKRFETIEVPINKKFSHKLGFNHVTTLDFFRLQPVMLQECIPGGDYSFDLRAIVSSAPLATQVYGGCHLDLHAFFVPFRILYENWNAYYAGNDRQGTTYDSLPYIGGYALSGLCGMQTTQEEVTDDPLYKERRRVFGSLGYPTYSASNINIGNMRYSLLPARCYQQVWWDYFRDSVNIPESTKSAYLDVVGGPMDVSPFTVRYRTFRKDYVSTLLSSPQLGSVGSSPVSASLGSVIGTPTDTVYPLFTTASGSTMIDGSQTSSGYFTKYDQRVTAYALRGALAMQRYLERLNVSGTRPMERLLSLLGAKPSPERLDMAEFLGGKTIRVNIDGLVNSGSNEQVSTESGDSSLNAWGINNEQGQFGNHYGQGYQTGMASGSGQTDRINYSATEHGYIIVIASLIPEYSNPNTVQRAFIRGLSTPVPGREDFFIPDFDGLSYEETMLCEVATPSKFDIAQTSDSQWPNQFNPYNVVGYRPKYEDYRFNPNRISGDFQENSSAKGMRYLAFTLSYPEVFEPNDVVAGINLTTSNFAYRELFDKHFQIADSSLDHFICYFNVVNDANLPLSGNQLPTELSDLANSESLNISQGGVRL